MSDHPIRRWTKKELDAKQLALESVPGDQWTREEHYAALEFIFQRYFPSTEPLMQSRWNTTMDNLRAKVDRNLELAEQGKLPRSNIAETNSLVEQHRALLNDSYDMPLSDFEKIVAHALNHFPFSGALELPLEDLRTLYCASGAGDTPNTRNSRDRLAGRYPDAMLDAATALRTIYETLRRAQNAGCINAKMIVPRRCSCLHDLLGDRLVSIADVLHAYEAGTPPFPPQRTPCTVNECPSLCHITFLPKSPLLRTPGDDEDFAKFMESFFSKDERSPESNWQQILEGRTRAVEREQ